MTNSSSSNHRIKAANWQTMCAAQSGSQSGINERKREGGGPGEFREEGFFWLYMNGGPGEVCVDVPCTYCIPCFLLSRSSILRKKPLCSFSAWRQCEGVAPGEVVEVSKPTALGATSPPPTIPANRCKHPAAASPLCAYTCPQPQKV